MLFRCLSDFFGVSLNRPGTFNYKFMQRVENYHYHLLKSRDSVRDLFSILILNIA